MHDIIDACEQWRDGLIVPDIGPLEFPFAGDPGQIRLMSRIQIVDYQHLGTGLLYQQPDQTRTDKAGPTRHNVFHNSL